MWTAPPPAGFSIAGWDIQRRESAGRVKVVCTRLAASQLEALHRVLRLHTPVADFSVRRAACPGSIAPPTGLPAAIGTAPPPPAGCVAYRIVIPGPHRVVEVRVGVTAAVVIALSVGKAVAAREVKDPNGIHTRFDELNVDEVVIYAGSAAKSLEICLDQPPDQREEDAMWAHEPFLAHGLQLPLRTLDPTLASAPDELALATARLLPGEELDADGFASLAEMMNAAAAQDKHTSPVWMTTVTRDEPDDPFIDLRTWSYSLATLVDPAWRRALAFGYLDGKTGLTPGTAYDYRVTGRFRRRDLDEQFSGFHTVPLGTTVPNSFALGMISLLTPSPSIVALLPEPAGGALDATGRKGIVLTGDPCLTLSFATPVTSVVLDVAPGALLRWAATTTEFLPGLPFTLFGDALPPGEPGVITTPQPVDTIVVSGEGFLFGIRSVTPGVEPDEVVLVSEVAHNVVFADSPLPAAPVSVTSANLQEPIAPTDPGTRPEPPQALGFEVRWEPAPPPGNAPVTWPGDLDAVPPFEALGFRIERRRVDDDGPFVPFDQLVFGSRGAGHTPPALRPGVDLLAAFADSAPPIAPVTTTMSFADVLVDAKHQGPPPGSTHQYRISAVDPIGRLSPIATAGPVVRLEKHRPPPQPVGPATPPAAGAIGTPGVRSRVLQSSDPDLAPDDRALLGPSQNAIVVEWGWTEQERDADPHAREFRVYWQPLPPDLITGETTGMPAVVNGLFELTATLDQAVDADAMTGRYLPLPDHPFRVAGHSAGQTITVRLEPSATDPAATPAPAPITFRPPLTGREQHPPAWAERIAVIAIDARNSYRLVIRDRLALDAHHPRATVWVGVSSADDQAYVADSLPAPTLNGGRVGNESAIVVAPVSARYLGRPDLTVPPPLPDVPEVVTDEPVGDHVAVVVDLPTLLASVTVPSGHLIQFERLGLDRIVAAMSARADGTVGAELPDRTTQHYTLSNPTDHTDLLAQIRTGTPARVEGRFLMDFLVRFLAHLDPLWEVVAPSPVAFGALTDTLASKAERYVHRIRLVDAAGHVSAGAAIPEQIVRVPSLRSPGPPEVHATGDGGSVDLVVRIRDTFDVRAVLVFALIDNANLPPGNNERGPSQLLRLTNRRGLAPVDGIRLRLADTTLLAPALVIDATAGATEPPDRILQAALPTGNDRRVSIWSATLTRDGIASRLAGPVVALTGPAPLQAPTPVVTTAAGTDTAVWAAGTSLLALERSADGGASWRRVTPWLAAGTTTVSVASAPGDVRYRAVVRGRGGSQTTGVEVVPT